ncbi:MAG: class I SAM-dependent methyltransferase [Deltaproteobacteria bacterium]|nr:class I SAM-dependent methyltransferase [Deltaproteobacteria bacterium]
MCKGTEKEFGYEWDIYDEIIPLHEKQFQGWINPIPISFFRDKKFLDAGCGIGRNSLWALKAGAASCVAFDYDERTVGVARKNLKGFQNCNVEFRSIYDISYENEFDIVFSTGVIHHLAKPEEAVRGLVKAVKSGGTLIIWVYASEGNGRYLSFFNPLRKYLTSKIPLCITRMISKLMTAILKIYLLFPHENIYLNLLKERSFRHTEAMVFDQLLPTISRYFTKSDVLDLIAGLPVDLEHLTHTHGMSWTLVAKKR